MVFCQVCETKVQEYERDHCHNCGAGVESFQNVKSKFAPLDHHYCQN